MAMKKESIYLGSDHAGFKLKEEIKKFIDSRYSYVDMGVHDDQNSYDYPDTAFKVAMTVARNKARGILVCGTGIGEVIVANKVRGIRAANCFNEYTAKMSREHNDSNVLCLGSRVLTKSNAIKIVKKWLETSFSREERHKRRLNKIKKLEQSLCK